MPVRVGRLIFPGAVTEVSATEVVATEVEERRDVEDHAVDPAHHQRVAGDLHRARVHPALAHAHEHEAAYGGLLWNALKCVPKAAIFCGTLAALLAAVSDSCRDGLRLAVFDDAKVFGLKTRQRASGTISHHRGH